MRFKVKYFTHSNPYYIYGDREETDKEYQKRMKGLRKKKAQNKITKECDRERQIEKLQKEAQKLGLKVVDDKTGMTEFLERNYG